MTFSVSTFNLCNLQSPGQVMFGEFAWTPAQYQRKVGWTAAQLAAAASTVMAFQEVWSPHALQDAFTTAGLAGDYTLACHDAGEGMQVACAVRRDWEVLAADWIEAFPAGLNWHSEDPRYALTLQIGHFSRPVQKLRLRGPDGSGLTVFNTHLKSRRPVPPGNDGSYGVGTDHAADIGRALAGMRRLAEAAVLRLLANEQLAQSADAVLIAGDCNDRHPGTVLDVLKGDARFRRSTNNRSGRRADWGLYHLLDLAPDAAGYTTFLGDDEPLALDHLLFSWHFHPRAADHRWRLAGWSLLDKHLSHPKPHTSDHALVRAEFLPCIKGRTA